MFATGRGIEDGEQLAHAGHDGDLFGLAGIHQALVGRADHGIVAGGDDGRHVQGTTHLGAAALAAPAPAQPAGVAGHRGDAHQRGDLATVQAASSLARRANCGSCARRTRK